MEQSKVRTLIRTGLVRVLLSLSGFLVRVTGLINSEKNSGQTADDESMNENSDSWPEAWTQRIKSAKHVSWFSFKAQRNAPFQRQKTLKNEASDKAPMAENRVNQDTDVSMPIHKPHSGARSAPVETIPPISRVFDPRTRLWIYESSGEQTSAGPELFPTDGGVPLTGQPGSEKAGITAPTLAPFPFQNMESERPLPERGVINPIEPLAPSSFEPPGKFREEGPDSDVHTNGNSLEMDRFSPSPIQTIPRPEARFTETTRNDTKSSAMASQERPTENVPSYPRWAEIGSFDDPAVRSNKNEFSSFPSHSDMPVKEQGPSTEGYKEEMAPALNRPWPELEEFEFSRDLKEAEHRGDNHDRLLRLKLEQKGSLWSVSRF